MTELHEVVIQFYVDEEVTPELFAKKVAMACARGGALRVGERVSAGDYLYEYVRDESTSARKLGIGVSTKSIRVPVIEEIHMSVLERP